jgi:dipeptidase E
MYEQDVLVPLRRRVREGMHYVGSSAGSNVAGVTIRSTNDMPVVEPPSLSALGIVPFCINPHYLDPDPASTHMGETREERIAQFHEENEEPVVGLREGAILRVEDGSVTLRGIARMRLFRARHRPRNSIPAPAGLSAPSEIIRRKALLTYFHSALVGRRCRLKFEEFSSVTKTFVLRLRIPGR